MSTTYVLQAWLRVYDTLTPPKKKKKPRNLNIENGIDLQVSAKKSNRERKKGRATHTGSFLRSSKEAASTHLEETGSPHLSTT